MDYWQALGSELEFYVVRPDPEPVRTEQAGADPDELASAWDGGQEPGDAGDVPVAGLQAAAARVRAGGHPQRDEDQAAVPGPGQRRTAGCRPVAGLGSTRTLRSINNCCPSVRCRRCRLIVSTPSGSRRSTPRSAARHRPACRRDTGCGRRGSCPRGGRSPAGVRARRCRRGALRTLGAVDRDQRNGAAAGWCSRSAGGGRRELSDSPHAVRRSPLRSIMPNSMAPCSLAGAAVMAVEDSGVSSGMTDRAPSLTRVNRSGCPRYPTSTLNLPR